ncbi:Glycerol kinase [Methyloversatilis universalis FAM5]|uniref:Glycerol kinase n=1 Tax=Methyloversatilis universalis (strain ATCC BAA-1314 / DSM 25237 / JCM 13912 / CCUG 52030 / FAM5) TaxID=1000565 RepID=F5RB99_METUF|nr:glycerol kinase GlpK [Methyloversatilis universalis]EGK72235.1 Glycerol kinase [Methyloversatilis universalis FAM5]
MTDAAHTTAAQGFILALDQGTTSSRALVFDRAGRVVAMAQRELPQSYPQPGWVEHDALHIWTDTLACMHEVLLRAALKPADIAAIGITNQRETVVLWDRATGTPLAPAIVWQDRRTADACARLRADGHEAFVRGRTGLVLDPYFSASKIAWLLDHVPGARSRAERGELACGTMDSWLAWQLTGGRRHITDLTNASRTQLLDIRSGRWDDDLLALFGVPRALLPEVLPSAGLLADTDPALFGRAIPLTGIAGDQQAALYGQGCSAAGLAKNTYGTGCFMLMHTGRQVIASTHGLLATCAAQTSAHIEYALEGSVFVTGALVQWLRDGLGLIARSADIEALAASVPDSGGVTVVPAFTGLGAPHWSAEARGALYGLTRGTTRAHIARAALEAIALQTLDVMRAMEADAGAPLRALKVDGGGTANALLMQMQADLLDCPVQVAPTAETTSLGAALLAARGCGLDMTLPDSGGRSFQPQDRTLAAALLPRWQRAVSATMQMAAH